MIKLYWETQRKGWGPGEGGGGGPRRKGGGREVRSPRVHSQLTIATGTTFSYHRTKQNEEELLGRYSFRKGVNMPMPLLLLLKLFSLLVLLSERIPETKNKMI